MKLKELLNSWSTEGIKLPLAYSADEKKPSITLTFVWISGMLTVGSTLALNFTESTLTAAIMALCFWTLAMVWYRIRRLDKFKINLEERSIELDAGEETKNE